MRATKRPTEIWSIFSASEAMVILDMDLMCVPASIIPFNARFNDDGEQALFAVIMPKKLKREFRQRVNAFIGNANTSVDLAATIRAYVEWATKEFNAAPTPTDVDPELVFPHMAANHRLLPSRKGLDAYLARNVQATSERAL